MRATLAAVLAGTALMSGGEAGRGSWAAGVPHELAALRRSAIEDVRYRLRIRVPADRAERVTGTIALQFALRKPLGSLVLDFAGEGLGDAVLDGRPVAVTVANEHVIVPGPLEAARHTIELTFTASDAPLNRSDDYLYSLFVPARARQALPCFDQPDLKARVTLVLDLPEGWRAVANGREVSRTPSNGRTEIAFAETPPLATYFLGFAAGRFSVEEAERGGRRYRMFHRETDAEKLARNRDALFDLHAAALAWVEEYTGLPYAWEKFDFFLVPAFQFGGMEHAGAVFYNAPALLLEPSATTEQLLSRASLIAHEVAHMWFGDYVTMRWFDDVWMKEVFANFMAAKIVNPSFPEIDHQLRFLMAHYRPAYDVDRTAGTHPIRQPLDNLAEAGALYGPIIYQKAPIVMRQLERLMGEDAFRNGLRQYLRDFAFGNPGWSDLITLLDTRSSEDLASWSDVWVGEAGRPEIRTIPIVENGGIRRLKVEQSDPSNAGRLWPQVLELETGTGAGSTRTPVVLRERVAEVALPEESPAPVYILGSGGGWGYGRFVITQDTLEWLLDHLPEMPAGLSRGAAWLTLWEEMLEGRIEPLRIAELALRAVESESDALNVQRLLSDLEGLYWRFLPPAERDRLTPRVEDTLEGGLARAAEPALKGAWFKSFVRTARSPRRIAWLDAVWRQEARIEGLELAEPDYILLAQELAVREAPGWSGILEMQQQRITNPDRRERFAFVRPALDADPAIRESFFRSLDDPARRRHEAWVLDGLRFLHHPLRAEASVRFVLPSLQMLEEIQRTGDIFFPKRWMDATLSGHQSAATARIVEGFLAERPQYPDRLRRIILQSADDLLRIVRSRESASTGPGGPD